MAQFVNIYPCDLRKGPVETSLKHMYLGDVEANRVGVNVTDGGEAVALSGTCSGTAILCNGGTVALTGVISGNQAYIDMPAAVYTVEGPVEIYLAVTTSGVTTTLLHGHGNAVRTDSGIVIDPGTIIPSVSALISDIDDAVASIPADYSDLLGTIAPDFSSSTAYTAGQYVWYSGTLYRFTSDHAAGSWTGTDAISAEIGEDVADLRGAVTEIEGIVIDDVTENLTSQFASGQIPTNTTIGSVTSLEPYASDTMEYLVIENIHTGDTITMTGKGGSGGRLWAFLDKDKKMLSRANGSTDTGSTPLTLTVSQEANEGYFVANVDTSATTTISLTYHHSSTIKDTVDAQGTQITALGSAVNDVVADIGDLSNLQTTAKNNLVSAINEAAQSGGGAESLETIIYDNEYSIQLSSTDFESGMLNASTGADASGSSYIRTKGFFAPEFDLWFCFLRDPSVITVSNLTLCRYSTAGVYSSTPINTYTKSYIGIKLETGYKYRFSVKLSDASSANWPTAISQISINRRFLTENTKADITTVYAVDTSVRDFMAEAAYDNSDYSYTNVTKYCDHKAWRKDVCTPAIIKWDYVENAVAIYVSVGTSEANMQNYGFDGLDATVYPVSPNDCKCEIYNLIPGTTYYYLVFAVMADGSTHEIIGSGSFTISGTVGTRMLSINNVENVRDIGGYVATNGHVKYGKIIRGANIHDPSDLTYKEYAYPDGIEELAKHIGVQSELDLTGQNENTIGWTYSYQNFPFYTSITTTDGKSQVASAFTTILTNLQNNKPVYVHCQGGCDRTGTLVTLLLGCLGVSESDLSKEFELSSFSRYGGYGSRRRDETSQTVDYKGLIALLKTYEGETLQEQIIAYLEDCGTTSAQISAFEEIMVE